MIRAKIAGIVMIAGIGSFVQNAYSSPSAQLPENFIFPSSSSSSSGGGSNSGDPTPTADPGPACEVYSLVINPKGDTLTEYSQQNAANFNGQAALTGPASEVSCIASAISWCSSDQSQQYLGFVAGVYDGTIHSAWNSSDNVRILLGDDCIGSYLAWQGKVRAENVCAGSLGCSWVALAGTYLFDSNCNAVTDPSSREQCSIDYTYWWSPISLLWEDGAEINDKLAIVQFPLNLGSSKEWYTWKASDRSPLLVYDPEHQGRVTSPTQLFGNWTFGGQRTAFAAKGGVAEEVLPRPWNDGYEALGSLDVDRDGELSGAELAPLALWFDSNQDGKSQAGEVKPIADLDVSKIFVTPNRRDPLSKEIYADRGFERRTKNGKTVIGKSVDWFGESFSNPLEGAAMMQARGALSNPKSAESVRIQRHPAPVIAKTGKLTGSLTGIWRWQSQSADLESYKTSGVLSLKDDGREVRGQAYVEVPLKKRQGRVARIVKQNEIQGRRRVSAKGEIVLRLTLKDKGGMKSISEATLSSDGLEMKGQTTAFVKLKSAAKLVPIKYSWTAKRAT